LAVNDCPLVALINADDDLRDLRNSRTLADTPRVRIAAKKCTAKSKKSYKGGKKKRFFDFF
jgi:hypothetical protein